jgi:hypothetical protein
VAAVPSLKGSAFAGVVEARWKLVADGELARAADRLEPQERAILEAPIVKTAWYDIRLHVKVLQRMRDAAGADHPRRMAERNVERLLHAGLYQQLEYLSRTQVEKETDQKARFLAFGRDLRLITTLAAVLYNFSRWEPKPDPEHGDRYLIEVSDASAFHDLNLDAIEAFINRMSDEFFGPDLWAWKRVRPDAVIFRMSRGVR